VVDNRTGKRYEIAISDHGTIKATDLKQISAGGDGVGLRTYDNGCAAAGWQVSIALSA
jgi:citrate synthase